MENVEFANLKKDIETSLKTIEQDGSGTKVTLKKLEDGLSALNKEMDTRRLESKSHRLFGTHAEANAFIDVLRNAVTRSNLGNVMDIKKSSLYVEKAALNTYGTGTGAELVPTATADVISLLLAQGGIARKYATVLNGVSEKIVLPVRSGTSTAVFTAGGGVVKDDVTITPSTAGTAKVTLSPSQIGVLSQVSEKLLYMSAINIAEFIAMDQIEQAGVLEDNSVIKGDGTATYNGITGLNTLGGVPTTTLANASFTNFDQVIGLPGKVHESVYQSPNAKYYVSGAIMSAMRAFKNSSYYYFDPSTAGFQIAGYPVVIWHRLDNTIATGKTVVMFGDLSKAAVIGVGRDMNIVVDHSFAFGSAQASFRLLYDFDCQFIQPTAMARLTLS
jgi:HK97 family phage major capsid protein